MESNASVTDQSPFPALDFVIKSQNALKPLDETDSVSSKSFKAEKIHLVREGSQTRFSLLGYWKGGKTFISSLIKTFWMIITLLRVSKKISVE